MRKPKLLDDRKFDPEYGERRIRFARIRSTLAVVVLAFLLFGAAGWLASIGPRILDQSGWKDVELKDQWTASSQWRTLVVQAVGVLGATLVLLYTARNYRLTRRGQTTDRFAKALERLGSQEIYVRIGAVHALEQVIKDSPEHHADVVEVLVSFVREKGNSSVGRVQNDVQAALTALARRPDRPGRALDLSGLNLEGAQLNGGRFACAKFEGSNLTNASLENADLRQACLQNAKLDHAVLSRARLEIALLHDASMVYAEMHRTHLFYAGLSNAKMQGARLQGADLRKANLAGVDLSFAKLTNADLSYASLHGTNLQGAKMSGARLAHAQLSRATLDSADSNGVNALRANYFEPFPSWW